MGFYDNNPMAKDAFANAGAIHDGTTTDSAPAATSAGNTTPTSAAIQTEQGRSGMQVQTDPGSGGFYEGNTNPHADPAFMEQYGNADASTAGKRGPAGLAGTVAYEEGGAVDDDQDQDQGGEDPIKALFAHGRQQLGLMQMAGAIPASPGTQSPNSPQPMPGPLPPTATPFGKRNNPMPAGKMTEVVPLNNGLKGAAGQYKNWGRDKTKPDDNSNVIPMQPKMSDAGAIPDEEEEAA